MNKIKPLFTIKTLTYLIFLFVVFYSITWIVIGAYYVYPNGEDLSLAALSRDKGIINAAINVLTTYDGRYTVNILHGLNPLAFNFYYGYKLMPIITFILFTGSIYLFLNTQFRQKPKNENCLYALVFISLFFSVIDLSASLYWMICSFVYIYPFIFFLFFYSFYLKYTYSSKRRYYLLSLIFLFLSIGCCELHLPIFGILLLILFLYHRKDMFQRNLTIRYIIVYIISVLFFVTSTGVTNRFNRFNQERDEVINNLFFYALNYSLDTFSSLSFIALLCFLIIFIYNYIDIKKDKKRIVLVICLGIIMIYMTWLILLYLRGDSGFASRITSVPVFIAVVAFIFAVSYSSGFQKLRKIQLLTLILLPISFYLYNNSYTLIRNDFETGKLHVFKEEMDKQYMKLTTSNFGQNCIHSIELERLNVIPTSISIPYRYILPNRRDPFLNSSYENYFNVDEVYLKNDTIHIQSEIN